MKASIATGLVAGVALALGACSSVPRSGGYYLDDGPHERAPADVANIPDAVPRHEPYRAANLKPYSVNGVSYVPLADARGYRERGVASWYGKKFHGNPTASGEPYDMYTMTAAHRTLPLPSYVRVRNLDNGKTVVVRVNDRGPFLHNRLIDLSYAAAARLDIVGRGTGVVEVEAIAPGEPSVITAKSGVSLIATAEAAQAKAAPALAVQVGAFQQYENAVNLRQRLERAGFGPIRIEPAPEAAAANRIYRVRITPVANVEHGDRLVADVARHGIRDALLIVD